MTAHMAGAYTDMVSAIEHVLGTAEYAATERSARAEMLSLAVCAALAERRSVYIPLPATITARRARESRRAIIISMFDAGAPLGRIVSRSGLSRRQVRRILRQRGRIT